MPPRNEASKRPKQKIKIAAWNWSKMARDACFATIGPRRSGKSRFMREFAYEMKFPHHVAMVGSVKSERQYEEFMPKSMVYGDFLESKLEEWFELQTYYDRLQAAGHVAPEDTELSITIDDFAYDRKITNSKMVKKLASNGRNYGICFGFAAQDPMAIPPSFRQNLDYAVIFRQPSRKQNRKVFEHFTDCFDSYEEYADLLSQICKKHGKGACMIIDFNADSADGLEGRVYWHKVNFDLPEFKTCDVAIQVWNDVHYRDPFGSEESIQNVADPGDEGEEDDEEPQVPPFVTKKRNTAAKSNKRVPKSKSRQQQEEEEYDEDEDDGKSSQTNRRARSSKLEMAFQSRLNCVDARGQFKPAAAAANKKKTKRGTTAVAEKQPLFDFGRIQLVPKEADEVVEDDDDDDQFLEDEKEHIVAPAAAAAAPHAQIPHRSWLSEPWLKQGETGLLTHVQLQRTKLISLHNSVPPRHPIEMLQTVRDQQVQISAMQRLYEAGMLQLTPHILQAVCSWEHVIQQVHASEMQRMRQLNFRLPTAKATSNDMHHTTATSSATHSAAPTTGFVW